MATSRRAPLGPPAIDRDFRAIDFLTLLDLSASPNASAPAPSRHCRILAVGQFPVLDNCTSFDETKPS
jgi:hypothetical protein